MWPTRSSSRRLPSKVLVPGFFARHSDHVVVSHVGDGEPRRNEMGLRRVALRTFGVNRVEQPVLRELRVEVEADEAALEAVIDGMWKGRRHVGINIWLAAVDEQV
jgi:hypothetical protein